MLPTLVLFNLILTRKLFPKFFTIRP